MSGETGAMPGRQTPMEVGGGTAADPFAAMLPLLRALPAPAVLHKLDGTVFAASAIFEDMIGFSPDGMSFEEMQARLHARFPAGWTPLPELRHCRNPLDQEGPEVAVDIRDGHGRFRALTASAGAILMGETVVGVVVLLTEMTRLL